MTAIRNLQNLWKLISMMNLDYIMIRVLVYLISKLEMSVFHLRQTFQDMRVRSKQFQIFFNLLPTHSACFVSSLKIIVKKAMLNSFYVRLKIFVLSSCAPILFSQCLILIKNLPLAKVSSHVNLISFSVVKLGN